MEIKSKAAYTIIATSYNDEETIIEFLDMLCKQTLIPREIIIADGGSTDKTVSKIKEFIESSPIEINYLTAGRLNIAQGYNLALKNTYTQYVGIVGIGNYYAPDFFQKLYGTIKKEKVSIAYSKIRGTENNWFQKEYNKTFLHGESGIDMKIPSNHGVLLLRNIFEEYGLFYEDFVYAGEDSEFYQRVLEKGIKSKCSPEAYMEWEVPSNLQQFIKQLKNYTIADLQYEHNLKLFFISLKRGGFVLLPLFAMIICIKRIVLELTLLTLLGVIYQRRKKNLLLVFINQIYRLFFTLRYVKYSSSRYKVERSGN